jgi:hypothetical protein
MRYFFMPSLLAAVAVADQISNEATAMSVGKESLLRKDLRGSGRAGTPAPGGRLMRWRRWHSQNQVAATDSVCHV